MVKLRLKRMGSKFRAFYRIVASDSRAPRDGRFIEEIGFYDPHRKKLSIKEELLTKWLNDGAKPTDTVKNLITKFNNQKSNAVDGVIKLEVKAKKVKVTTPSVDENVAAVEEPVEESTQVEETTQEENTEN